MRSISVSRKGGKLDLICHGVVEEDKDVNCDGTSESTGIWSKVTGRLVAPTPSAVPYEKAAPAGGQDTAAATSLRGATMKEILGSPVHSSSAGTPGSFAMSTPPATSTGVNAPEGTASPGASIETSPFVSEESAMHDNPSPELGGMAAHELRY